MESMGLEEAIKMTGSNGFLREIFYQTDSPETFVEMMKTPRRLWIEIMSKSTSKITIESIARVKTKVLARQKKRGFVN